MRKVTVIKRDLDGRETWKYTGSVIERFPERIILEARFNRPDTPFYGITIGQDDRFIETFYTDRWYNIFEIHDRQDDGLKAWYCNVGRPAEINDSVVSYIDLALDLLVFPDGKQLVLDEDEFEELALSAQDRLQCKAALGQLQAFFRDRFRD